MTKIASIGKFLDQPVLTAKLNKHMPEFLTAASGVFIAKQLHQTPEEERKRTCLKSMIILGATGLSAINAPKIAAYITKKEITKPFAKIVENNTKLVTDYFEKNKFSDDITKILEKAKNKILSVKEIDKLNVPEHKEFLDKLVPPPKNIQAKDIFKEIGWLSVYGAIPVAGGIAGGIAADKITGHKWKQKVPNKIKEGVYQYFANIFMCNIGAGIALGVLEKLNIKSKAARCAGMTGGILLTGVIGGSAIANFIGNKFINPVFSDSKKKEYRHPELVDLGLHTDDIATISLLSGLKWIEPSLPLLYAVSGYRAGIGYRNDNKSATREEKAHFLRQKC